MEAAADPVYKELTLVQISISSCLSFNIWPQTSGNQHWSPWLNSSKGILPECWFLSTLLCIIAFRLCLFIAANDVVIKSQDTIWQ